jgi:mono/diheme cytochrome c family protein
MNQRIPFAAVVVSAAVLSGCASVARTPYPPIAANTSAQALQRGESIFRGTCEGCHRGPDSQRVSGTELKEMPEFLGTFYSANITSHPTQGIGSAKDEELARIIRYGVSRDGRLTVMPASGMGDDDLAAVLGFIRSDNPLFEADEQKNPPPNFSFVGRMAFNMAFSVPKRPASGIPVPPKAVTVEYGRYMAHDVHDCSACHTAGMDPDRAEGKKAFAGGFEFRGADGKPIFSSNITFDSTGIEGWSYEDFARAVRDGLAPDGVPVRWPMPRFRGADETDLRAIYEYLRSRPPTRNEVTGARPRQVAKAQD